jgi:hypothetical protein
LFCCFNNKVRPSSVFDIKHICFIWKSHLPYRESNHSIIWW